MFKIYGSAMCPDCRECKANFDYHQVEYQFIDITRNLKDLHEFLTLRDTLPVFDHCKEIHDIGLPALVKEDGTVFLDWEGWMKDQGLDVVYKENRGHTSCSLDRKGC